MQCSSCSWKADDPTCRLVSASASDFFSATFSAAIAAARASSCAARPASGFSGEAAALVGAEPAAEPVLRRSAAFSRCKSVTIHL